MARQKGVTRFEGSIGALSFYRDKRCGDMVRRKGGPSKKQIRTLKSCRVVRQNNSEFGRASRAGKLLRYSFYPLISLCGDNRLCGRVQKRLMEVLKKDTCHRPGERVLLKENFAGFGCLELREGCGAGSYFELPVSRRLKEDALAVKVCIEAGRAAEKKATHFKVVSVAATVNFKTATEVHEARESGMVEVGAGTVEVAFEHVLKGRGTRFHGLCLMFYQRVNGAYCLLQDEGLKAGVVEWME